MSKENLFSRNGTLSPSIASSSPTSSRSSSSSSSTPSMAKVEDKMIALSEIMNNGIKEEISTEVQNAVSEDINKMVEDFKEREREVIREEFIKVCISEMENVLSAVNEASQDNRMRIMNGLKKRTKAHITQLVLKELQENFSSEWQDIAVDHTEHVTEDIEIRLWSEMSGKLQSIYRVYRNTANTLKIDKQASVDMTENRLESLLTQVQINNNERVRYLTNATQQYLHDEIRRRELEFQMQLELETRTLRRELAQIRQNAQLYRETKSTACVLL